MTSKPTKARIFIDGEAGTTGLQIRERLERRSDVMLRSIPNELRKDGKARRAMMREVDLVVLCLPDDAAKEAAEMIEAMGPLGPKVIDASTAHRVDPDWVYGFPELSLGHSRAIAAARRVSNPGCYPTGAIALIRPLVDIGILSPDHPVTINAVSGYSGGGRQMIETYQAGKGPSFELYGLTLKHKHVPELMKYAGLTRRPLFVPSVGNFRQGMLVSVPLHLDTLKTKVSSAEIETALARHYAGSPWVKLITRADKDFGPDRIEAEKLNDTNMMELRVYADDVLGHALLVARLDNLGKGASGAAVQNMELMLGLQPAAAKQAA